MTLRTNVTIEIPDKAQQKVDERFMEAARFDDFCCALGVPSCIELLEAYERAGVLFPVARIIRPRALTLHRHLNLAGPSCPEPEGRYRRLCEFEGHLWRARHRWDDDITNDLAALGHPIERELRGQMGQGVLQSPADGRFRSWRTWRFPNGFGGLLDRAIHYYSPWQVIVMHSLDALNSRYQHSALQAGTEGRVRREFSEFKRRMLWDTMRRDVGGPEHPVHGFEPRDRPGRQVWPSPWVAWAPWFERVESFGWRVEKSIAHYRFRAGRHPTRELWDEHLARQRGAATSCTEGTERADWTRLLRALCRLDDVVQRQDQFRLQLVVRGLIRVTCRLQMAAYGATMVSLSEDHDGEPHMTSPFASVIDGGLVRPGYLWAILNQRSSVIDREVRPWLKREFADLQRRLQSPLPVDTDESLLETLGGMPDEPLLTALAGYVRVTSDELNSPWTNGQRWSAVRAVLVALESEAGRWFGGTDGLFSTLNAALNPEWERLWQREVTPNPELKRLPNTDAFVAFLRARIERGRSTRSNPLRHCNDYTLITYVSRNWSAHHGRDPDPWQSGLAGYVVTCALQTALVLWSKTLANERLTLMELYPESATSE
jgi:hypothetical protein